MRKQKGDFSGVVSLHPREEEWMAEGGIEKKSYAQTLKGLPAGKNGSGGWSKEDEGKDKEMPCLSKDDYVVSYDEKGIPVINLSSRERERLHHPCKSTLIVKLLGKRLSFPILKKKIEQAWARSAAVQIIYVGNDFFFVRFNCLEDYDFALTGGPWLFFDHYLTVCAWEPNFNPFESKISKLAVWARFPWLTMEYYDDRTLFEIGDLIGMTLKIDANT